MRMVSSAAVSSAPPEASSREAAWSGALSPTSSPLDPPGSGVAAASVGPAWGCRWAAIGDNVSGGKPGHSTVDCAACGFACVAEAVGDTGVPQSPQKRVLSSLAWPFRQATIVADVPGPLAADGAEAAGGSSGTGEPHVPQNRSPGAAGWPARHVRVVFRRPLTAHLPPRVSVVETSATALPCLPERPRPSADAWSGWATWTAGPRPVRGRSRCSTRPVEQPLREATPSASSVARRWRPLAAGRSPHQRIRPRPRPQSEASGSLDQVQQPPGTGGGSAAPMWRWGSAALLLLFSIFCRGTAPSASPCAAPMPTDICGWWLVAGGWWLVAGGWCSWWACWWPATS